jgi:hypothetical protein
MVEACGAGFSASREIEETGASCDAIGAEAGDGTDVRGTIGAGAEAGTATEGGADVRDFGGGADDTCFGRGGGPEERAPPGTASDQPGGLGVGGRTELGGADAPLELAKSAAARASATTRESLPSFSASSAARRNHRAAS